MRMISLQNIIRLHEHMRNIRRISLIILRMTLFHMRNLRIRYNNFIRHNMRIYDRIDRTINFTNNMHAIYCPLSSISPIISFHIYPSRTPESL